MCSSASSTPLNPRFTREHLELLKECRQLVKKEKAAAAKTQ